MLVCGSLVLKARAWMKCPVCSLILVAGTVWGLGLVVGSNPFLHASEALNAKHPDSTGGHWR